jgi:hypothetical protein
VPGDTADGALANAPAQDPRPPEPDSPIPTDRLPRAALRATALVLALFGLVPMANLLSGGHAVTWWGSAVQDWILWGAVTLIAAMALARFGGEAVGEFCASAWRRVMAPAPLRFGAIVSFVTLGLSIALAGYAFARQPHSIDEMEALWQSRIYASGHFAIAPFAHREFVSMMNVIDTPRWYTLFPAGGPALLTLGTLAGVPWLVDPICAAIAVAAVYMFVRRAYDESTARATAIVMTLSPFFLFMAAGYQNHVPALAALALALAALAAWRNATTPRAAVMASVGVGLALGVLVAIRPLDGALAAAVFGVFQVANIIKRSGAARWSSLAAQAVAGAIPVAFLLIANANSTGHPLTFAYGVMWGGASMGFGATPFGEAHTPVRALVLLSQNLMRLDLYLFEWPIPGILLALVTLVMLRTAKDWDLLAAGLIVAYLVGYALYWHEGFWVGPRFIYPTIPLWILFTVRAPALLAARTEDATHRRAVMLLIPLCMVGAIVMPSSVTGARLRAQRYHESLWQLRTDIAAEARAADLKNALVVVHESWGARLMARMWAVGVPRRDAELLLAQSDACALELQLLVEESPPGGDPAGLVARLRASTPESERAALAPRPDITADGTLKFSDHGPFTKQCADNALADSAGVSLYPAFLARNHVTSTGELGGEVIYVRDLGAHNLALRKIYGDRVWYHYMPRKSPTDSSPVFVKYH